MYLGESCAESDATEKDRKISSLQCQRERRMIESKEAHQRRSSAADGKTTSSIWLLEIFLFLSGNTIFLASLKVLLLNRETFANQGPK